MSKPKIDIVIEAVRKWRENHTITEGSKPFVIYRASTGAVLKRGIYGYDNAVKASNLIRKNMNLKWDEVKFKVDKSAPVQSKRIDYAPTYNPSKGRRFRGYYTSSGEYHDID